MLTTTSPCLPAVWRAKRTNSPCALCSAPIVGTSTRGLRCGSARTAAIVVRTFTPSALSNDLRYANYETRSGPTKNSNEQDKDTGNHQREHPNQIDVEPRAAQHRNANPFVNHNGDQRRRYKIPQGVDYDRRGKQGRCAETRERPCV